MNAKNPEDERVVHALPRRSQLFNSSGRTPLKMTTELLYWTATIIIESSVRENNLLKKDEEYSEAFCPFKVHTWFTI